MGTMDYATMCKYLDEKTDWYADRIGAMKTLSAYGAIETKNAELLSILEVVNLEISLDQAMIVKQELSGIMGSSKKKLDIYKDFLVNLSHRLRFYSDTHIRGA